MNWRLSPLNYTQKLVVIVKFSVGSAVLCSAFMIGNLVTDFVFLLVADDGEIGWPFLFLQGKPPRTRGLTCRFRRRLLAADYREAPAVST